MAPADEVRVRWGDSEFTRRMHDNMLVNMDTYIYILCIHIYIYIYICIIDMEIYEISP